MATGTDMVRSGNYDFLIVIVIHINYGLILYHVSSDSGGKLHIFHKLYFMTLLSVLLSKFDNIFWLQKLEWCADAKVWKSYPYVHPFQHNNKLHQTYGQTDVTAKAERALHAIAFYVQEMQQY